MSKVVTYNWWESRPKRTSHRKTGCQNHPVLGLFNILEACRYNPVDHLVYASSSSVYRANKKVPFAETDMVDNPVYLYVATKKSNELMAQTYSHLYKIPAM